jgi:amino acid transporter
METKKPSLYAAIAIGVSSMIGSGWLFACYYAAKEAGPASLLSWVIGAVLALILALLLSEIVGMFQVTGLFSRLLTLSHNRDYGFIAAISNWLGVLILIPSEAEATIQYLSSMIPSFTHLVFHNGHLTMLGNGITVLLILVYWVLNYWGMKLLAKTNNVLTLIKIVVPVMTAVVIMGAAFHPGNFTSYRDSFAPYGLGASFNSVVNSGIFYAFYGFNMITIFAKELRNPKKNVPIALISAISIALVIYLLLQVAFIGAMDSASVAKGWHQFDFTSPLAQLSQMLGLNILLIVLYADAAISPSGTAIIFTGSGSRMLSGMAMDKQVPSYFSKKHKKYHISRRALAATVLSSMALVFFFDSWQTIMVLVSVFMLISSVAVPLSFARLRHDKPGLERSFRAPFGHTLCLIIYVVLMYLLSQAAVYVLVLSLVLHVLFFLMYSFVYYQRRWACMVKAFYSCWSMFLYLGLSVVFGYLHSVNKLDTPLVLTAFIAVAIAMYFIMLNQKNHQLAVD